MTQEKLQSLLESGQITQEEYDELAKNIKDESQTIEQEQKPNENDFDSNFDKLFQQKFDRAMAKERKEKADLKKKLETLQKKMLTDEEQKQYEIGQREQELEEQRKELMLEKNKMYAVKSLKKAEISDSEEAMLLMERIVLSCTDETEIDETIAFLKAWKDKEVAAEVKKRFRENGEDHKKSSIQNGGVNPFKRETFNLTEQIRIINENPELAARLKLEAGVK